MSAQHHDLIAIGASAGGVEALRVLVGGLPATLNATVLIALHTQAGFDSRLPDILTRSGPLPARHPVHGERIVPGTIFIAPPDLHLEARQGYLHVTRGPKENGHRPSVDVLFRSAARAYGPRVIGVVLTGYLDCGTAGLQSIAARGGLTVVEDPATAAVADMPRSALAHSHVQHVQPIDRMGALLGELSLQPVGTSPPGPLPTALLEMEGDEVGPAAELVCPLCQGKLTFAARDGFEVYRCHVGHAFSLGAMAEQQAESLERALWSAVRALEESARLSERMARGAPSDLRGRYEEKTLAQYQHANTLREMLLKGDRVTREDVAVAVRLPTAE